MKILTPGHLYELSNFEEPDAPGQRLQFIQKEPVGGDHPLAPNYTLRTVYDGTTNEEVLSMLIDRLRFLGNMVPCRENSLAITRCEEALMWLNKRTSDRKARGVEGTRKA